jgi:hypothetical protein
MRKRDREERVGEREGARCDSCAVMDAMVPNKMRASCKYFLYGCIQPISSQLRETEQWDLRLPVYTVSYIPYYLVSI